MLDDEICVQDQALNGEAHAEGERKRMEELQEEHTKLAEARTNLHTEIEELEKKIAEVGKLHLGARGGMCLFCRMNKANACVKIRRRRRR